MNPQVLLGPHLEELFQRARTAGERNKSIAEFIHARLSIGHSRNSFQVSQPRMGDFLLDQDLGDDTGDTAAVVKRRVSNRAHKTNRRATVDELHPIFRECLAEAFGGDAPGGVVAEAGAAENSQRR